MGGSPRVIGYWLLIALGISGRASRSFMVLMVRGFEMWYAWSSLTRIDRQNFHGSAPLPHCGGAQDSQQELSTSIH